MTELLPFTYAAQLYKVPFIQFSKSKRTVKSWDLYYLHTEKERDFVLKKMAESDPRQWYKVDVLATPGVADRYDTVVETKDGRRMRIIWPGYVCPKHPLHLQHVSAITIHVLVGESVTAKQTQKPSFQDYFYYFAVDVGSKLEYIQVSDADIRAITPPEILNVGNITNKGPKIEGSDYHLPTIPFFIYNERLALKGSRDNVNLASFIKTDKTPTVTAKVRRTKYIYFCAVSP